MDRQTFLKSVESLCSEMSPEKKAGFIEAMGLFHELNTDAAVGCLDARMPKDVKKSKARYDIFNLPNSIRVEYTSSGLKDHINSIKTDIMADLERYFNSHAISGEKYSVKSVYADSISGKVTVFLIDCATGCEPDEDFYSDERFDDFLLSLGNKYGCYVSICSDYFSK